MKYIKLFEEFIDEEGNHKYKCIVKGCPNKDKIVFVPDEVKNLDGSITYYCDKCGTILNPSEGQDSKENIYPGKEYYFYHQD